MLTEVLDTPCICAAAQRFLLHLDRMKLMYNHVNPKNDQRAPLIAEDVYKIIIDVRALLRVVTCALRKRDQRQRYIAFCCKFSLLLCVHRDVAKLGAANPPLLSHASLHRVLTQALFCQIAECGKAG